MNLVIFPVLAILIVNACLVLGWSYHDQCRWSQACNGEAQSPVAISSRIAIPKYMSAIKLVGYNKKLPGPLTITNNGHTVALTIPKYSPKEEKRGLRLPYITGAHWWPLNDEYEIEGWHFHWGDNNYHGSEHTLDGIRFPLEMHIVHWNKKYKTMQEAKRHSDGLCVLAVFYKISLFDLNLLKPIVRNLPAVRTYNSRVQLHHTFPLTRILKGLNTKKFYTYNGSLTTPPCAEAVTWVVFSDLLPVSMYEMGNFRRLLTDLNHPLVNNFRHLQKLNGRDIYVRVPKFLDGNK